MSKSIRGTTTFQCSNCHSTHTLPARELDFKSVGSFLDDGEQYAASTNIQCKSCGQTVSLHFQLFEGADGKVKDTSHSVNGAGHVRCSFRIVEKSEDETDRQNRLLGSAAGGAILGASLGGPFGAVVGGALGALLGNSVNQSKSGGKNG